MLAAAVISLFIFSANAARAEEGALRTEEEIMSELPGVRRDIESRNSTWEAGVTSMSYLTTDELHRRLGRFPGEQRAPLRDAPPLYDSELPAVLDWRNNNGNWVSRVKNQGYCGSCYAFAAVSVLESSVMIDSGTPGIDLDLSEQSIVDCGPNYYPYNLYGCYGATAGYNELDYLLTQGAPPESCMPYYGDDYKDCSDSCGDSQTTVYRLSEWGGVSPNVEAVKRALITYGPVVAAMDVDDLFAYYYRGGVYDGTGGCYNDWAHMNHAVVIVGWQDNPPEGGGGCWIVKNSWGTGWGEQGYFRIRWDSCGITLDTAWAISMDQSPVQEPGIAGVVNLSGGGADITDVLLTLSGAADAATYPDPSGNYSFTGLAEGDYTVTPSLEGYVFTPESVTYTSLDTYFDGQDIAGAPIAAGLRLSVKGENDSVFGNSMDAGENWGQWQEINGSEGTATSPAIAEFDGSVYLFTRKTDSRKRVYYSSLDEAWNAGVWLALPHLIKSKPVTSGLDGRLYLFVKGRRGKLYYSSMDADGAWSGWLKVGATRATVGSPAAVSFNDRLYLFRRKPNNRLYYNSMGADGIWAGWRRVDGSGGTKGSPTVLEFNNRLYLLRKKRDNQVYYNSMGVDGGWSGWQLVPDSGSTASPSACEFNNRLYLFSRKAGGMLYQRSMDTSGAWNDWKELSIVAEKEPSLAVSSR